MRAALLSRTGGPDALDLVDLDPPRPGPGEVLVQVAACGVCGHDQADRAGLLDIPLPTVLGHEISGVVVETGAGVTRLVPGDRVAGKQFATCGRCEPCTTGDELRCPEKAFTYGGYAEYAVLRETSLLAVPPEVDLVAASVVACAVGTGLQALRGRAGLRPGETALVTGAGGGLGLHGVQVAAALDARVVALTGDAGKADRLRELGADEVVVARDEAWRAVLEVTGGHGADVVLDIMGAKYLARNLEVLATNGRLVVIGRLGGSTAELDLAKLMSKRAAVLGTLLRPRPVAEKAAIVASVREHVWPLVARGTVRPVIHARWPLAEVAEAHRTMEASTHVGKLLLTVT